MKISQLKMILITSFKLELTIVVLLIPVIFFIDTTVVNKLILFITLMLMPLVESINSAIERVVDLVTLEHHDMAGRAKDVGSTAVFFSIIIFVISWGIILFNL